MVEHITYKGVEYPIKISFYALMRFQKETGLSPDSISDSLENYVTLFYYALEAGHKIEGKPFEVKRDDVPFMLDDVFTQFTDILNGQRSSDGATKDSEKKTE